MNIINTRRVNTNNSWGFGGWSGTITEYDNGIIIERGRNSYRHTGTSAHTYVKVRVEGDFCINVTNKNSTCLNAFPIDAKEVYIYNDGTSYRAMVGECVDFPKLFNYSPEKPELFKIIKLGGIK